MSESENVARNWDNEKKHIDRSEAIAAELEKMIPLNPSMKALEYGAGTGLLSFLLKDRFAEITLIDNSQEMIKVCEEKAESYGTTHIKPLWFDLEHKDYDDHFDIIYNQMVLHHLNDYEAIIHTFHSMLNPGGYLAIADLYPEDGSFHGPNVKVHRGFDPEKLTEIFRKTGFTNIEHQTCFEVTRDSGTKYPVFLLVGQKPFCAMEPTILRCKQCNWQGSDEEVDWENVETCAGTDKTEVCPSCGSMEVNPVRSYPVKIQN